MQPSYSYSFNPYLGEIVFRLEGGMVLASAKCRKAPIEEAFDPVRYISMPFSEKETFLIHIRSLQNRTSAICHLSRNLTNIFNRMLQSEEKRSLFNQFLNEITPVQIQAASIDNLYDATEAQKQDLEFTLESVRGDGASLEYASPEMQANKGVVLEALRRSGFAFEFASEEIRSDKEMALIAVAELGTALQCASKELQNDRDVVLKAVKQSGQALEYASSELQNDREVVVEAIKKSAWALEFADPLLQNDQEMVLEAVKCSGLTLKFASADLRNDKVIVEQAIKQDVEALKYASAQLQEDREFLASLYLSYPERIIKHLNEKGISFDEIKFCLGRRLAHLMEQATPEDQRAFNRPLRDLVSKTVVEYRNYPLAIFMQQMLIDLSCKNKLQTLLHSIERTMQGVPEAQQKYVILPFLFTMPLDLPSEKALNFCEFYKNVYRFLKHDPKQQALLIFLRHLQESQMKGDVSPTTLIKIMEGCFISDFKNEGLKRIRLVSILLQQSPALLKELSDFSSSHLNDLLLVKIKEAGLISESIQNLTDKFLDTFFSSRLPSGIFTYTASFFSDEGMKIPIRTFIENVLEQSLSEFRHEHNSHKHLLTESQKDIWETSATGALRLDRAQSVFNIKEFLEKKVQDGHALGYLQSEIFTAGPSRELERPASELEQKVYMLFSDVEMPRERQLSLIEDIESLLPDELEFRNDLRALKKLLIGKPTGQLNWVDTEDWQDLFLCGTEILGSCQRIDGIGGYNSGLMGYCLDGKVRMLAVKDSSGRLIARALLKLFKKAGEDKPALFLERMYPSLEYRSDFIALALKKAEMMGVELYEEGLDVSLVSLGNTAGVEYEDGGSMGNTNGVFTLKARKISSV